MVKIVLLNGFMGSGKDTLGQLICQHDSRFRRYALSEISKDIASERHGFERHLADHPEAKNIARPEHNNLSIRDLVRQIWVETDQIDKLLFTNKVIAKIIQDNVSHVVITDFRLPRDFDRFVAVFGQDNVMTIKIQRQSISPPPRQTHFEEYKLENFNFDHIITNHQTPIDMYHNYLLVVNR